MVQKIDVQLFDEIAAQAAASPRLRMNHNFHSGPEDNPHRFLNVLLKGTYVRPHRHIAPPKAETFLVLEGMAEVVIFNDDGKVTERYRLGDDETWGVDIAPGRWHTLCALTDRVVCFEVKPGPWEPSTDKDFASWAPKEGDPAAAAYLRSLIASSAVVV